MRIALEVGAGTTWGSPSVQRIWHLGGPSTLRGYDPLATSGESFGRGRAELARSFSFGRLSVFSDLGWAGDHRDARLDDALQSVGIGMSILDGLIRFDGAWALDGPRDFRFDAYLDQIL
jgi:hemolysin activation/secretion protein